MANFAVASVSVHSTRNVIIKLTSAWQVLHMWTSVSVIFSKLIPVSELFSFAAVLDG